MLIIQRIFPSRQRNKLYKIVDLILTIPVGKEFCSKHMYQTLIFGIILTLDNHRPWKGMISNQSLEMERQMCGMREICEGTVGHILRKCFHLIRKIRCTKVSGAPNATEVIHMLCLI